MQLSQFLSDWNQDGNGGLDQAFLQSEIMAMKETTTPSIHLQTLLL